MPQQQKTNSPQPLTAATPPISSNSTSTAGKETVQAILSSNSTSTTEKCTIQQKIRSNSTSTTVKDTVQQIIHSNSTSTIRKETTPSDPRITGAKTKITTDTFNEKMKKNYNKQVDMFLALNASTSTNVVKSTTITQSISPLAQAQHLLNTTLLPPTIRKLMQEAIEKQKGRR